MEENLCLIPAHSDNLDASINRPVDDAIADAHLDPKFLSKVRDRAGLEREAKRPSGAKASSAVRPDSTTVPSTHGGLPRAGGRLGRRPQRPTAGAVSPDGR